MKINIIYPKIEKKNVYKNRIIKIFGIILLISALISILINCIFGGKPWSLIACVGMYMLWHFLLSPTLIEYNRTDQFIKLLTFSCLLLHFIDIYFARGFGILVIPIVLFSGIIFSSILLFTDYESQKYNLFSVFLLLIFSLTISIIAILSDTVLIKWVYYTLFSVSLFYIFLCSFILKNNIFKEFKKRFQIK